ncbi:hypothetical protein [Pseudoxanthomonas mexicana]
MHNHMEGATRYEIPDPEVRRPGITAIMDEIRAESPDLEYDVVVAFAKQRWHARAGGQA